MGIEIERKFLVQGDGWRSHGSGIMYRQGYLLASQGKTVRVRLAGDQGFLTVKGPGQGMSRQEFEYTIPGDDAKVMLEQLCEHPLIEKRRYTIPWKGFVWEVDEFLGNNQGLILAEIELESEDQQFPSPPWVGREVTGDPRYYNACLFRNPYSQWHRHG